MDKPGITFFPLKQQDIDPFGEIAATAPDPWNAGHLQTALENPAWQCYTAFYAGRPAAFACFNGLPGGDSSDLQLIAVHPALRHRGIGRALLAHSLAEQKKLGRCRCLLEVRASNTVALGLYRGLGFKQLALRPAMYSHPVEDGILMGKDLTHL